jgi:DNA-binding response OmpR family regulator
LDQSQRQLLSPENEYVSLTNGEFALLSAFLEAPQQALSRVQLISATRMHEDIRDASIDVQVFRLRRKLRDDPDAPRLIRAAWGVGYIFAPEVKTTNAVARPGVSVANEEEASPGRRVAS